MTKKRLDLILVDRGYFKSRAKAQAALMAGKVEIDGKPAPKPGTHLREDVKIDVIPDAVPFVSRGGIKLDAALHNFAIDVRDRTALDVGASTGGFTDCLLQRGAKQVFAVDVGRGQIDQSLRDDPRVVSLERTHARDLTPEVLGGAAPDIAVVDVSFISLTKVLAPVFACLQKPFEAVVLIKPQFELEPKKAPKGVVRTEEFRKEAVARVRAALKELPVEEKGFLESPIKGPKGNVEFLLYLKSVCPG